MNPAAIAADLIGAVAFWLTGVTYREQLGAAVEAVQTYGREHLAYAAKWYRHNAAASLRPLIVLWMTVQIAVVAGSTAWIFVQTGTGDFTFLIWLVLAWLSAIVPGAVALFMLRGTRPVNNWTAYFTQMRDTRALIELVEDITKSLQTGELGDITKRSLRQRLDRLFEEIEERNDIENRTDELEQQLQTARDEHARITLLHDLAATRSFSEEQRLLLRQYRRTVEVEIQEETDAVRGMEQNYGRPANNVALPFLLFILAPFLTGITLLLADLCVRQYNGVPWTSLLPVYFGAFLLYLMGETALDITAKIVGGFLEALDTVFDKTLDAIIKPLLVAGLVGTTFSNVSEKFGSVDLPLKEAGGIVKKLPTSLLVAMRSVFLWSVIFPWTYTVWVVSLSAVCVSQLIYKLNAADLKDDAKAFLKKVAKTEHKILYFGYAFWLVALFWLMLTQEPMPVGRYANNLIDWINSMLNASGWQIVGSIVLGLVILVIASNVKGEGLMIRVRQGLTMLGSGLLLLPLIGLAAWLGGGDIALPHVEDPADGRTVAPPVEAEGEEPDAFDRAAHAAGRDGPSTGSPEDGLLGSADAHAVGTTVHPTSVAGSVPGSLGDTGGRSDVPPIPTVIPLRASTARLDSPSRRGSRDCSGLVPSLRSALEARGQCL